MTLTIDLPQDLARELATEANKLGIPLSDYALRLLYSRELSKKKLETGDELVAYWQEEKLIGSRQEIEDSQRYARQIRTQAETRVRE